MIHIKSFIKEIDTPFWKHITKESPFRDVINFRDIKKNNFLMRICEQLNSYNYHFRLPLYLYAPKSKGVVRKVKIYSLNDLSIYYYCVKMLQDEISKAIKTVKNVYGGFRMTSQLKLTEEELEKLAYDPTYESSFNKIAFRKEWSEYQKLASTLYDRNFKYYIHLDITHFYDDINLDLLERNLRNIVSNKQEIIDILFYFLRNSDKRDLGYNQSNVGIPQESIGEMSRLLANFYLHSFDKEFLNYFKKVFNNVDFIYTRYADDMWICFNGKKDEAKKIIQVASFYLQKLKLHLNENKIEILNRKEFYSHWYFSSWDKIHRIKRPKAYLTLFNYLTTDTTKDKRGRWYTPANFALKVIIKKENVKLFNTFYSARVFVETLLQNPKLTDKVKDNLFYFLEALIIKYPKLISTLRNYLKSPANIYPHLEYFILSFLSRFYKGKNKFDYFFNFYKNSQSLEYQWYSRVICQGYFLENLQYFNAAHHIKKRVLLNLVEKKIIHMNYLERRYTIFFLIKLNTKRSKKILSKYFTNDEDISFIHHLKAA